MARPGGPWIVTAAAVLVLVTGFLPWWTVRYAYSDASGSGHLTESASAWGISTAWTCALLLTAAVTAVWAWLRAKQRRAPRWGLAVSLLCAAVSVLLIALVRGAPLNGTQEMSMSWVDSSSSEDSFAHSWMIRDRLFTYDDPDLMVGIGWGWWAGLIAILLCAAVILRAGRSRHPGL
ncbi:hypothetical protein [Allokutzneria albata]|uniref:hypothetical protein n=1 Tax=Allokutzneria albata TaxID=211114 RepID=UPI0012DBD5E3|nr:hypothetical protein [Allokutzneria albata]